LERDLTNVCKYLKEDAKRTEPGSFQWCAVTGQEAVAQTKTQEVPSEHQETLFHCEGEGALAQVAQRGCGLPPWRPSEAIWTRSGCR